MRLFAAIEISDEVRERCTGIIEKLSGTGADIRTVSPENLHITLKFLGEVREDDVNLVCRTLGEISSRTRPFTANLSGLGYFGGPRSPRTIWAGISEGREIISGISDALNSDLNHIRSEERKPHPHLTLARARTPRNSEKLIETIESLCDVKLGELHVKEMKLKSSILKPVGPEYMDFGVFALGRPDGGVSVE